MQNATPLASVRAARSGCLVDHDALKLDPAAWQALHFVGIQDGAGGPDLELRNCRCGSTLAIELPAQREAA